MRRLLVLVMGLGVGAGAAWAADAPDPLVKRHLDAKDTPYKIDDDNDFAVTVDMGDGRTHQVYVISDTNAVGNLRVREIWATGYQSPDKRTIPVGVANRLLEHSHEVILGSWVKQGQGTATFVIKVPADASADDLDRAIDTAASTADKMELEFTGETDEF
jgi:hypothetical protein